MATLFAMLILIGVTSCEKDEPGSNSSHMYFSAMASDGSSYFWWVIDMDTDNGAGYEGKFKIQAWTTDGKKKSGMKSYSGKYTSKDNTFYITWDHQSMNTMWRLTNDGIQMVGSSNPSELDGYTYYYGSPDFE